MSRMCNWFFMLSSRTRDSFYFLMTFVGLVSTFFTIFGVSLGDLLFPNIWMRLALVIFVLIILYSFIYLLLGEIFSDSVHLCINGTSVHISYGDIFEFSGWKVIGCDSHFDTRVDDRVISKNSLHGKMMLEHGTVSGICRAIDDEALRLKLSKNEDGLYDFPLGSIICYRNSCGETYLMLAMTELDDEFRAFTDMATFESMLMKMWIEIDRVYAGNQIVMPLLGTGISRFKDGFKKPETLLRCLLCTLNVSGVNLNSNVCIVIYDRSKKFPFYEYKHMFKI